MRVLGLEGFWSKGKRVWRVCSPSSVVHTIGFGYREGVVSRAAHPLVSSPEYGNRGVAMHQDPLQMATHWPLRGLENSESPGRICGKAFSTV